MPTEISRKPATNAGQAGKSSKQSRASWIDIATYAALGIALVCALAAAEIDHLQSATLIVLMPE